MNAHEHIEADLALEVSLDLLPAGAAVRQCRVALTPETTPHMIRAP